jgi:hypothetical protein
LNEKYAGSVAGYYTFGKTMLPIGQKLALQQIETDGAFPPMQSLASYNLNQVMKEAEESKGSDFAAVDRDNHETKDKCRVG